MLYRYRSGDRDFSEESMWKAFVGIRSNGSRGIVFSVHDRDTDDWERRFPGIICALLFSLHILVIDYFSPRTDGVKMSCIQFFVCGILSGVAMLFTEEPHLTDIFAAWIPILYAGVMSCGVAYTLQIVGQKGMNPTVASLILSLESCISVLAGWLILGQKLSVRELSGCLIMFGAIILAQLPGKQEKSSTDL